MFDLNETTLLSAINGGGLFSVINSVLYPGYGIYYADGTGKALNPTSFLGVEFGADATVVTAPIEGGSYTSYNKVKRPSFIRVIFTLEGLSGFTGSLPNITNFSLSSRTGMLSALDEMVANTRLYDIETPDTTYEKYDLVRYNYKTSDRDVTLLTVEAIFQAVLEEAEVTLSSTTAESKTTNNSVSKSETSVNTPAVTSGATAATQNDVGSALSGLKKSVSSAYSDIATKVTTTISDVAKPATTAISGAATSAINGLSQSVTELVKVVT